jgi:hypothetical protein
MNLLLSDGYHVIQATLSGVYAPKGRAAAVSEFSLGSAHFLAL